MTVESLCELALEAIEGAEGWETRCRSAFEGLFDGGDSRYHKRGWGKFEPRINAHTSGVPYAALIHPDNPDSGAYGGMSFVLFPPDASDEGNGEGAETALFGLVVGTGGLHPDEEAIARPGHARKSRAICTYLNRNSGVRRPVAWAKSNPARTDQRIPGNARASFQGHDRALEKYGEVVYAIHQPPDESSEARKQAGWALKAYLDLMCEERGVGRMSRADDEAERIRNAYLEEVFETWTAENVFDELERRRYAVLQGPPGTGKTRLAGQLLEGKEFYSGRGQTVQFHPSTTYEDFVGGLAPVEGKGDLGFRFEPSPGALMRAAERALEVYPQPFLLHIDEINRADLAKVLGEAIYLFEHRQFREGERRRTVDLAHDFGGTVRDDVLEGGFGLPENLHVLGTMNTSDRSIAHLDVAIRRRFSFLKMWPQQKALRDYFRSHSALGEAKELEALVLGGASDNAPSANLFGKLVDIFVDFAPEDALELMPGHSYFLADDVDELKRRLDGELLPLLEQYIREGHVAGFADELRSYMQFVEALE